MEEKKIVLNAQITIYGTKSKRTALNTLQVMLDDYDDNNSGMGGYKEVTIHIL